MLVKNVKNVAMFLMNQLLYVIGYVIGLLMVGISIMLMLAPIIILVLLLIILF